VEDRLLKVGALPVGTPRTSLPGNLVQYPVDHAHQREFWDGRRDSAEDDDLSKKLGDHLSSRE
jgi:hypothetical protein